MFGKRNTPPQSPEGGNNGGPGGSLVDPKMRIVAPTCLEDGR